MQNYSVTDSWFPSFDGTCLYRQEWKCSDPKAVIVFLHGLGDHSNRHISLFKKFNDANMDVIAMDERGHGLTQKGGSLRYSPTQSTISRPSQGVLGHLEGFKTCYRDVDSILSDAIKSHSKRQKFILMGHSMGGLIALKYMIDNPENHFCAVILNAPAIQPGFDIPAWKYYGGRFFSMFWKSFTMPNALDLSNLSRDETVLSDYLRDPCTHDRVSLGTGHMAVMDGKKLLTKPVQLAKPTLIAHGTADRITSYQASKEFFERLECPNKKFLSYEGGYHELTMDTIQETVIVDYLNWIDDIVLA